MCQGCGACDYEHEVEELGVVSGDYNPMMAELMKKTTKFQDGEAFKNNLKKIFKHE